MYSTGQAIQGTGQMIGAQQAAQDQSSILQSHLQHLQQLQKTTQGAIERAARMADALLGSQPSALNKADQITKGPPVDPPLTAQLSDASHSLHFLLDELHSQLARLERL